jgi:hypothetical protein
VHAPYRQRIASSSTDNTLSAAPSDDRRGLRLEAETVFGACRFDVRSIVVVAWGALGLFQRAPHYT